MSEAEDKKEDKEEKKEEEVNENQKEKKEEKENEEIKEIKEIKEEKPKNKELMEEIKTNALKSKNEFLSKMKKLIEDISSNFDNLISTIENDENKEASISIFNNIEEFQKNIIEENENLNSFLKQSQIKKESKEENDNKILKIDCNSDINVIQRKLEKTNFEKIIIKGLASNSFNEIFESNGNKEYNDIIIKKANIENYNLKVLNNINKFKIKRCKILFGSCFLNFKKINELYLESINLFNEDLDLIFQGLIPNINNLKIFSIKNNNITKLNLNLDKDTIYNNLEFLNLSSNKINKITENNLDTIPKIKLIDLTNNNLNFICRYKNILNICKNKNCIILLAKNPGIIKEKSREEYCNYLKEIIPDKLDDNSHVKYLNLEGLFINKTYPILSEINFNNAKLSNLNSLNLSHNNLNDQDFIKLIENNKNFFNKIKKLILCSNYITEEGINSLVNNEKGEYSKIFDNLKKLDLSGNPIRFSDLNQFKNMINFFPNLKTLLLKYTSFEKDYNNYLKMKAASKIDKENKELTELDKQFEELMEKERYFDKKKINIKMMNTNGLKYFNLVRKYFPYLLYNIKLETKFIEE